MAEYSVGVSPPFRRSTRSLIAAIVLTVIGCAPAVPRSSQVLLYAGAGTSPNDVTAVEEILAGRHLDYSTADARQLNAMSASQLGGYRLLIVPGGDFIAMSNSLTRQTTANIHDAVQRGLNFLGICAGAFLAADGTYNNLNLTSGTRVGFYAAERAGIRKAAVVVTGADGSSIEHYWEDGPELSGWGSVVGRYPDGTPAVVEGASGKGWVILTGVHPEAPESWRRGLSFATPARDANAYASTLVEAALEHRMVPHY